MRGFFAVDITLAENVCSVSYGGYDGWSTDTTAAHHTVTALNTESAVCRGCIADDSSGRLRVVNNLIETAGVIDQTRFLLLRSLLRRCRV